MLERLVTQILNAPLALAREFKQAGGDVIGYVGSEIPTELIIAADAMPFKVPVFNVTEVKLAKRYLEKSFAPAIQAVAEQYLLGWLDFLKFLILPRSNDSAQRLYYYLCELKRRRLTDGPKVLIYDLARIPRATSQVHSEQATGWLARTLGVDQHQLPQAIALRNRRRKLLAAANLARIRQNNIKGSFINRVLRAADLCQAAQFDTAFSQWLELARRQKSHQGPRLLLVGSAPCDERLHLAVEKAGGNVVAELGDFASLSPAMPLVDEKNALPGLTHHYRSMPFGPRAFVDRVQDTLTMALEAGVDGVILWLLEQEEALIWDVPAQLNTLEKAGIATLSLTCRKWDASDGALDEIISFTRNLKGHP